MDLSDEEKEYIDSTGKYKSNYSSILPLSIRRYLSKPSSIPIILLVILICLTLDMFPFKKMQLNPFGTSIDVNTYDFFAPTQENVDFYKKLNNYISPNREPFGFQNYQFSRVRATPGSPPIIENPGIYPLNNLNPGSVESAKINTLDSSENMHPVLRVLGSILTLGGRLGGEKLPKRKIYIILSKSPNIGIEREKSRQAWLIEKLSIINKKSYALKHNYELVFANSYNNDDKIIRPETIDGVAAHQKRYQHESREGWERFDYIRQVMRTHTYNNPKVEEWYWYLDLYTLVMQPERSLEETVFSLIESASRSGAFLYKPDNLDSIKDSDATWSTLAHRRDFARSDIDPHSSKQTHKDIDLILTEDCYGINLDSFLLRRSKWSELLLDMLWEPVVFRQMHFEWSKLKRKNVPHKYGFLLNGDIGGTEFYDGDPSEIEERNCLEYFLTTQAWLRTRTAVLPIRVFNSISNDTCVVNNIDTLDLIDAEMDDDLIDALLESDELDLLLMKEKLNVGQSGNRLKELALHVNNMHYDPQASDFIFNFAACKDNSCWKRMKEGLVAYQNIHGTQIFDI